MPKLKKEKDLCSTAKLILILIFLFNPTIKTVDLLPDFVACIMAAGVLYAFVDRAPDFAEARDAFIKLGWLSAVKLPAFFIMIMIRSKNTADNDVITLFTLVFAIFEAYFLILAIKHLFSALFHVGMRSGADATVLPISLFGGRASLRPEFIKNSAYVAVVVKAIATVLPEMLLLSSIDPSGAVSTSARMRQFYPSVLLWGMIFSVALSFVLSFLFLSYVKAIRKGGGLLSGISSLSSAEGLIEIEEKIKARSLKARLNILMIASFFSLDLVFTDFGDIDLVPNFIFGIFLFISAKELLGKGKARTPALVFTALYTVSAAVTFGITSEFLKKYSYSSLVFRAARDAYLPVVFAGIIEFILLAISFVTLGIMLTKFTELYVLPLDTDGQKTRTMLKNMRNLRTKVCIFSGLGIISALTKLLTIIFNYYSVTTEVEINSSITTMSSSLIPWFDSIAFIITAAFIGYCCYFLSSLNDEIELRYS